MRCRRERDASQSLTNLLPSRLVPFLGFQVFRRGMARNRKKSPHSRNQMSRMVINDAVGRQGRSIAGLVILVALVSFLAGRYLAPAHEGPAGDVRQAHQDKVVLGGKPAGRPEAASCGEVGPLSKRIVELESRYRALVLVAAVGLGSAARAPNQEGATPPPLPFPEGLPPAHTPKNFKAASTSILQKCMPTVAVQDADCSEYPCIAWASFDASAANRFDVTECDDWSKTMGKKTMVYVELSPDGTTGFYGLLSLPEDEASVKRANARAGLRIRSLAESYGIVAP
jgi:hypothetical protein